jgi:hypothetical protein
MKRAFEAALVLLLDKYRFACLVELGYASFNNLLSCDSAFSMFDIIDAPRPHNLAIKQHFLYCLGFFLQFELSGVLRVM